MWLLRARYDHGHCGPSAPESKAQPGGDRYWTEREPVPLLRLHKRSQGGRTGCSIRPGGEMNSPFDELEFTEPERYELHEGPFYRFEVSRREFVATLGAGLII